MDKHHHASTGPITFAAIAGLQLSLASCSPGQPSPPPPFIPYEITPGDAAVAKRAVDNIRASRHSTAPAFAPRIIWSFFTRTANYPATYPATLTIDNRTDCKLGFYFTGPSPRQFGIEPGQSAKINIAAGSYEFGIDTRLCAGDVRPLYGSDVFSAGRAYTYLLSRQNPRKGGNFNVRNETGADLRIELRDITVGVARIEVGHVSRTVGIGPTTIPLPEGTYVGTVTARCGSEAVRFEMKQGSRYEGRYWCVSFNVVPRS